MIATIKGEVTGLDAESIIVEASGLGYRIFISAQDQGKMQLGETVKLHIYEQLRDDTHDLYGFEDYSTKELFESLLGVSKVGPKLAMAILSSYSSDQIRNAITSEDVELLKSVKGVGKRTAERLVVDLKNKLEPVAVGPDEASVGSDLLEALKQLGYSTNQARSAIAQLPEDLEDEEQQIKQALRIINS